MRYDGQISQPTSEKNWYVKICRKRITSWIDAKICKNIRGEYILDGRRNTQYYDRNGITVPAI
jgi:hypothetical protein